MDNANRIYIDENDIFILLVEVETSRYINVFGRN